MLSEGRAGSYNLSTPVTAGRATNPLNGDTIMGLIYTLCIGLIVGAIAKFLMPGKDPGGWIITILLGIAGAFVG